MKRQHEKKFGEGKRKERVRTKKRRRETQRVVRKGKV